MRLSLNWLKEYVDIDVSPQELANGLTMAGLEVESLERRYSPLDKVVIGEIKSVAPHPNADRLTVCEVNAGSATYTVVCGAPNVKVGLKSPLALQGAELPNGMKMKAGKVRGVTSEAMLCAEDELGLSEDHSGIMELADDFTSGKSFYDALNLDDYLIEIGVTPNRPDCLNVWGVARETAALLNKPLHFPHFSVQETLGPIERESSVTLIHPDGCPRYVTRLMTDIKIGPSPFWMREKVIAAGMRPINNVVDVTNFVLMEMGQPLHAFDFDFLQEGRIVVRYAEEGDKFITLDDIERTLPAKALMICDGKRPVALAGIMGGLNSEIQPTTRRVLLESAFFTPSVIRRTAKRLGMSTEASFRFERGTDPDGVVAAANRATQLMVELAGAKVYTGVIDEYPHEIKRPIISTKTDRINSFLGTSYSTQDVVRTLTSIDLEVDADEQGEITAVPPSFRMDIMREVDLYEEVARLKSYDTIPVTMPGGPVGVNPRDPERRLRMRARDISTALGFSEVINYSFVSPLCADWLNLPADDRRREHIALINPISEEQAVMRTSLLPGLINSVKRNIAHKNVDLMLFELGKIFFKVPDREQPEERFSYACIWTGARNPPSWLEKEEDAGYYDLKGALESFLERLGVEGYSFEPLSNDPIFVEGLSSILMVGNKRAGALGALNKVVRHNFDLDVPALCFDLDFGVLTENAGRKITMRPLPKHPSVARDLVIIVPRDVSAASAMKIIEQFGHQKYMESVSLFDVYEGEQIGSGKVSLGYRIVYRSPDRNLTDKEVNKFHDKLISQVLKNTGGVMRT